MAKKTTARVRPSAASSAINSLDLFAMSVKATRKKIKPTLRLNPVKRKVR